jgi:hypothetical protein
MNAQMPQPNKKWSVATFSIFSEILTTDEIGSVLGLYSTRTHVKGEPRGTRKKDGSISTTSVWPNSAWHLGSPLGYDANLADHIRWLLDAVEPKLGVLKTLSAKCHPILLQCGFSSAHGQGGFTLDGDTLARIAKLGVSLSVDLYPPAQTEESDNE